MRKSVFPDSAHGVSMVNYILSLIKEYELQYQKLKTLNWLQFLPFSMDI
jgi:hypothetical protein